MLDPQVVLMLAAGTLLLLNGLIGHGFGRGATESMLPPHAESIVPSQALPEAPPVDTRDA
jgi:hypothetical protein